MIRKGNDCNFVLKELSNLLEQKEDCKDNECKITDLENSIIFKTEKSAKAKNLLKRLKKSQKYCDCIIFKRAGKQCLIIIIEILCGTLTQKGLKNKTKQITVWKEVVEEIFLKRQNILGFICYQKADYTTFGDRASFKKKKIALMDKNICLAVFKKVKGKSYHIGLRTLLASYA